jgi:hypothetical protein
MKLITKRTRYFTIWRHLDSVDYAIQVFERTCTWWYLFGIIPVWGWQSEVEVPVWLKVRQMTLGY